VSPVKLLVVEDDRASLELMTEVFTALKAEVRPLSDAQTAALLVDREKFDGIFVDLEMPILNGAELAQRIRKSSWNRSTPIVILSGVEQREAMKRCFATGATFFLQMPIDKSRLVRLFHTVHGSMLENRRRYLRVPLQTPVSCVVGSRTLTGTSWNISQGGMQVEVDSLQANDTVRLSLKLPESAVSIEAVGRVVWTKDNRQGIQFTKMTSTVQEEIKNFIGQTESWTDAQ
jgi:CheY-like chemotaxis protein